MKNQTLSLVLLPFVIMATGCNKKKTPPPNILILMSDNQSWNHLGCYGDRVVRTPNIDKVAAQGLRFTHAFCAAPSCAPARAGMLTGQDIWRLEEGANLWGILPVKFEVYPEKLEKSGYITGFQGKGWGPGSYEASGRTGNPGGTAYNSFEEFIGAATSDKSWFFWFSSTDPHRPFAGSNTASYFFATSSADNLGSFSLGSGSGKASGMNIDNVFVPPYLPDNDTVRSDICDYYSEIERFDREVGHILEKLTESGQSDNTIIIICSDNGWQMPCGLANLYDAGTRVPLVISWKGKITEGRVVEDFVNLNDLAPTFLELAGLEIPEYMTANSLTNILFSEKSGRIEKSRDHIITARERHAFCRQNGLGYPCRAIRTYDFLYIRNYEPDRWPAGDPPLFGDIDAHMLHYPSPTKVNMMINKDKPEVKPLYDHAFMKRPPEELYDLQKDPWQLNNISDNSDYQNIKSGLSKKLNDYLETTRDPRILKKQIIWDKAEYFITEDFKPKPCEEAVKLLNLKPEYNYLEDK